MLSRYKEEIYSLSVAGVSFCDVADKELEGKLCAALSAEYEEGEEWER
jgi:hypothetical protein